MLSLIAEVPLTSLYFKNINETLIRTLLYFLNISIFIIMVNASNKTELTYTLLDHYKLPLEYQRENSNE